jgi:phospholipase/carboxylesterase
MGLEVVERPATGATERILVLLPGFCDEPSTWTDHLELIDPEGRWHVAVPRPPVTTRGGPAWYRVSDGAPDPDALRSSIAAVVELVTALTAEHSLSADQVVLAGFSQGGATALATSLDPSVAVRPAALAVLAGYLPHRDGDLDTTLLVDRPVLFAHGTDDEMMDVVRGRSAARALHRGGASVTWHEVESAHRLGPPLLDPMRAWLTAVAAGAVPSDPPT